MMGRRAERRDLNEDRIVAVWDGQGWPSIKMHSSAGFDRLVINQRGVHIVEIKNPAYAWELTELEKKTKALVESGGGVYHIVQWPEEAILL